MRIHPGLLHRFSLTCTFRVALAIALYVTAVSGEASAQVSGIRGFDGGVAPLFNLVGPGNLYLDSSGTQGYIYNFGYFESYNFRSPGGQGWAGAQGTLGPQLSIGLIQGANQAGAPVVLPPPPRQLAPAPPIGSTLLDFLDEVP
ncbi:hypothetical protein YTPLAS18_25920 [Nitrospira sp.]|nr:hypothetical protein YTPLAS18_25920 [Nitrospira sp.]